MFLTFILTLLSILAFSLLTKPYFSRRLIILLVSKFQTRSSLEISDIHMPDWRVSIVQN